jgi:1-acyl-sn-glycerol-3-phosphate acyltransferase
VTLKKFLLNMYFWPMFLLVTILGLALAPFILIGSRILPRLSVARAVRQAIRIYGWILIRLVPFMAPVVLDDRSGGFDKPVIFIPNHNSSIDPFLFAMLPLDNAFVTSWPFKIPLYNFFMHLAGYINSTKGWMHVQKKGKELLESGCSLIIWPEGHRSRTGQMGRFKKGAFKLALATGRQIVPVCIIGSQQVLPPGDTFLTPVRIKVILLPAIAPGANIDNQDAIKVLKDQTKACIAEELLKHSPIKDTIAATPKTSSTADAKNLSDRNCP